jgi:Putative transposase
VWRVGADPDAPWARSTAPRHAHLAGFDLHANVEVPAADRARLEQLCRYLLRPAVAHDRLRLLDDGRIVLTLKTAWADGTRQLMFEPLDLLEKLAALTPRPRINLVLYHGVLAPHSNWRHAWSPLARRPRKRQWSRAQHRMRTASRRRRRSVVTGRGPI